MTIREALREGTALLQKAGVPDADVDACLLLANLLKKDTLVLRIEGQRELSEEKQREFEALLARREKREPLQYILGETEFMGLTFHVEPRVLDIGTGSGALAISLAKLGKDVRVTAADISDAALAIAKANAERLSADVEFVKSDCFSALKGEKFDMIISNPPYISDEEMKGLMPEVLLEPHLALFGGEDGLDFYRRISREAPEYLNDGGWLIFEIGWLQKDAVCALLRENIGEPFAERDYGGNWRVVGVKKE